MSCSGWPSVLYDAIHRGGDQACLLAWVGRRGLVRVLPSEELFAAGPEAQQRPSAGPSRATYSRASMVSQSVTAAVADPR